MQSKRWVMRDKQDTEQIRETASRCGIPPLLALILLQRGVSDIAGFLDPAISRLEDPFSMRGMDEAAGRIIQAIDRGERIMVYGDYDVDGITSTACVVRFLREHHAEADFYIPDRRAEGYGINSGAVRAIAADGYSLIITVDCGITAVAEVALAKSLGVDVIVTDHHECKEELPDCCIVNPRQPGCAYPFKQLAGVGVAFKLLCALTARMKFHMTELYDAYLDIVAIGTVADVMPLVGENRVIVKRGLELLAYTPNKGLRALLGCAGLADRTLTAGSIGFTLAPRINAAGRIGDPKAAVELLLTQEDKRAQELAELLDSENRRRQESELAIYNEARAIIENDPSYAADDVLVLAHPGWHHGVIGIVASRLCELYYKPTILISTDDGKGKGSGRSIHGFNLFDALCACAPHLEKFGGHTLAAGLSLREDAVASFRQAINEYAHGKLNLEDRVPQLKIDCELPIAYLNLPTLDRLRCLEPYGAGNPNPVFALRGACVQNTRPLSEGRHMKVTLLKDNYIIDCLGFGMGDYLNLLKPGDIIDAAFTLDDNVYRGERQLQVQLKDIRLPGTGGAQ